MWWRVPLWDTRTHRYVPCIYGIYAWIAWSLVAVTASVRNPPNLSLDLHVWTKNCIHFSFLWSLDSSCLFQVKRYCCCSYLLLIGWLQGPYSYWSFLRYADLHLLNHQCAVLTAVVLHRRLCWCYQRSPSQRSQHLPIDAGVAVLGVFGTYR